MDTSVLTLDSGEFSQDIRSNTFDKLHGTNEDQLFPSFIQVLPLTLRGGRIEQNLLMLNIYLIKPTFVLPSDEYSLEKFISNKLSEIKAVEYIFASKEENIFHVWIIINKLDRDVRDTIYDIQYDILENFRRAHFDFHIICREDRDINELFGKNAIMIYRR